MGCKLLITCQEIGPINLDQGQRMVSMFSNASKFQNIYSDPKQLAEAMNRTFEQKKRALRSPKGKRQEGNVSKFTIGEITEKDVKINTS